MKWQLVDDYHAKSDCGRYTVCRIQIDRERTYEAWEVGRPSQIIDADCKSAKEAQQACERHAAKKEGKGE